MNRKIIKRISSLCFCSLLLFGCTAEDGKSILGSSVEKLSKYVEATRVYDLLYEPNGWDGGSFTLDAFPNIVFEPLEMKAYLSIGKSEEFSRMQSVYVCDFNCDGRMDLAFTSMIAPHSSSNLGLRSRVFDFQSESFLYDSGVDGSHVLDLDDDGNLIVEQMIGGDRIDGHGYNKASRACRFLKEGAKTEWFDFGFKVKSVYMDGQSYSASKREYRFPVDVECTAWIYVDCVGKENILTLDSVTVETGSDNFSYEVLQNDRPNSIMLFYMTCASSEEESFDLKISIGGASCVERVSVYKP